MAEAIFARYGGGSSIPAELRISDYTKFALGLNANATLDECLRKINSIDANTGLAIVTLKDVDGAPLGDHNIRITDAGGLDVTYTTDGMGQCSFKTINGVANFYDASNLGWFDLEHQNALNVNIPIGSVQQITLQRYRKYNNGDSITLDISTHCNFSKFADKTDVEVRSADGGVAYRTYSPFTVVGYINTNYIGNGNYTFQANTTWLTILSHIGYYRNPSNGGVHNIYNKQNINMTFEAARGADGSSKRMNNINICNQNIYASIQQPSHNEPRNRIFIFRNRYSPAPDPNVTILIPYTINNNNIGFDHCEISNGNYQAFRASLNRWTSIYTSGTSHFGNYLSQPGGGPTGIGSATTSVNAILEIRIGTTNVVVINNGSRYTNRGAMNNIDLYFMRTTTPFKLNYARINLINFRYK